MLADARLEIKRNRAGRSARSFLFVGLRCAGKTVLLNEVQAIAEEQTRLTDFIEAARSDLLSATVIASLHAALLRLDRIKGVSGQVANHLWTTRQTSEDPTRPHALRARRPMLDRGAEPLHA